LYRGQKEKVRNIVANTIGEYATDTNILPFGYRWYGPYSVLVDFYFVHETDGSGDQPLINIEINGTPTFTVGVRASTSYANFLFDDFNLANLQHGDDLSILAESSASAASDLTVILVLVTV
jgi:hypothetical protein